MLALGIILCYLSGLSVMLLINRKYLLAELIGYSFLIGIGIQTVFLFLLDLVGVPYSQGVLIGLNVAIMLALNGANYKGLLALKDEWKAPDFSLKNINFVALFLLALAAYLFYVITVKNLFWPATEHDSISSFDKLARIMAIEGKLKISLFTYGLEGAGGVYPPLFHGSLAYAYIFSSIYVLPKIMITLYFLSLLTVFYSVLTKYVGSTAGMLFTFILMITPELFSHAALGLGNLPTTAYVCAGGLATILWLDKGETKYFWLGAICMAFTIWIRSDAIVFTAASLLLAGIYFLRSKDFKRAAIYAAIVVSPFIVWMLYVKLKLAMPDQGARFDFGMGYNAERMAQVGGYAKAYLFGGQKGGVDGGQLYGIVFILFFVVLLANIIGAYFVGVRKSLTQGGAALLFFAVSFLLYFTLFYFINVDVQGAPLWSLMESSFKRGMFFFIPAVLLYVATSPLSTIAFEKLERFRTGTV